MPKKEEDEEKSVRVGLPMDVHDDLRIVAAEHRQTIAAYVRSLIQREVDRWREKKEK